jgi:hypothetical protein
MKVTYLMAIVSALSSSIASAEDHHDVIGGETVSWKDWSAHVQVRSGSGVCSGVVIGPRTVLSAAHCHSQSHAKVTAGDMVFDAVCTKHVLYPEKDFDIALCRTDKVMSNVVAENISFDGPQVGEEVQIFGYGCTKEGGTGELGILHKGNAKVTEILQHEFTIKGAAACFGDSGGGVSFELSLGKPVVVGVSSKGNIRDTSWVALLGYQENIDFMKAWTESNPDAPVCGLSNHATQCRGAESENPSSACEVLRAVNFSHFNKFKKCLFEKTPPSVEICGELKQLVDRCFDEGADD